LSKTPPFRIALAAVAALVLGVVPTALAGKPGGPRSCTRNAPSVYVENSWMWGSSGSWGTAGQQLRYQFQVINNDVYCSSSSFTLGLSAPDGFGVSIPTTTINLKSTTNGYLFAYVTSPASSADGDYPLTVTALRSGTSGTSTSTVYKVYSTDTVRPTLYWPNPGNGMTLSGSSYAFTVSSNDDHAVKKIDLYLDGVYQTTTTCEGISYDCQLYYPRSLGGLSGPHSATFKGFDWMGNETDLTTNFTVG
jgi:hypothetical protein